MIWWSLLVVCYATTLRESTQEVAEMKTTTGLYIQVEGVNNHRYKYDITEDTKVGEIKEKLYHETHLKPELMKLLYYNTELQSDNTIVSYELPDGTVLTQTITYA